MTYWPNFTYHGRAETQQWVRFCLSQSNICIFICSHQYNRHSCTHYSIIKRGMRVLHGPDCWSICWWWHHHDITSIQIPRDAQFKLLCNHVFCIIAWAHIEWEWVCIYLEMIICFQATVVLLAEAMWSSNVSNTWIMSDASVDVSNFDWTLRVYLCSQAWRPGQCFSLS